MNLRTRKVCLNFRTNLISQCTLPVDALNPPGPTQEETIPILLVASATLATHPIPPPAVEDATCPPPAEIVITIDPPIDEARESREKGPLDVNITPGVNISDLPIAIAGDLASSSIAEPTIKHVEVQSLTPNNDTTLQRATVVRTLCEGVITQATQASHEAESTRIVTEGLAGAKGVAEGLDEAERAAREAVEQARVEQGACEEKGRQVQLKLEEEHEARYVHTAEVEKAQLETLDLQRQAELVEKQTTEEGEKQKLGDAEIAKLEAEVAQLEADDKEREQARLVAEAKDIEEASDCPVAPSTPRSELGFITPRFDSPSQISLASHVPAAPDSPRIAPDDPTPFVELPESDLILQNRSPKSINSSIAAEAPETPLGSLPNESLLAVSGFLPTCFNAC